ncbi:Fork head transcription factor 1 [Neolecta irregularis DAH-3]|uniref:Fork head transcription factor 1 n=1 Tax=Neolecta irregularis (strain DAH-3) TaxID=1198029 RepID=A0A1U7LTA9_NEOID|nr:Fork head transcription factor 1 [Neolecta irregularis DAH-3]|eukprot:OLL25897.1 Fork head transcription factor 1 [Neolecta irregularis DAH-3]
MTTVTLSNSKPPSPVQLPQEGKTSIPAYAKLEFQKPSSLPPIFIQTLQALLGRKVTAADHVDVHLGHQKNISRHHARLFYNFATGNFEILVLGKNGIWVDGSFYGTGMNRELRHGSKITIGDTSFCFFLPNMPIPPTSNECDDRNSADEEQNVTTEPESPTSPNSKKRKLKRSQSIEKLKLPEELSLTPESTKPAISAQKPPQSYAQLILEILSTNPEEKFTLPQIYRMIAERYPYYAENNGWQSSIRHNLSGNKLFKKIPREDHEPGKGAFWSLDREEFERERIKKEEKLAASLNLKKRTSNSPDRCPAKRKKNEEEIVKREDVSEDDSTVRQATPHTLDISKTPPIVLDESGKLALNQLFFRAIMGESKADPQAINAIRLLQNHINTQLGPAANDPKNAVAIANALAIALAQQIIRSRKAG